MTVRDVIQKTGLSATAVYKKIKAHGMSLESLKDKETGQFTPDAEKKITELFNLGKNDPSGVENQVEKVDNQTPEVEKKFTTEVEKLKTRVAELTTEVEKLNAQIAVIASERDYLRQTLEREQQLHGLALSKLPSPQALPAPGGHHRSLWDRIRGRGKTNG